MKQRIITKKNKIIWILTLVGFLFGVLLSLLFFILVRLKDSALSYLIYHIFYFPASFISSILFPCHAMECWAMYAVYTPPAFYALLGAIIGYTIYIIKHKRNKK